jgi:hypothetical protein
MRASTLLYPHRRNSLGRFVLCDLGREVAFAAHAEVSADKRFEVAV